MGFGDFIFLIDKLGIYYFLVINLFYFILILLSFPAIFRRYKELQIADVEELFKSDSLPPVCIIVPMHNEEKGIIESIEALSQLSYPCFSIIVVNDGSTDGSLECVKKAFKLQPALATHPCVLKTAPIKALYFSENNPNLMLVDKERGGKGDALNAGINATWYPLILTVDADTVIEKEALLHMVPSFVSEKGIGGQGGTVRILNKGGSGMISNYLAGVQSVEYLRAFLYGRLGWNSLGGNLIVSGAFGLFDRAALVEIGGYIVGEVTEDLEVTIKLTRRLREKYQKRAIQFMPDPVAWTRGPETIDALGRQRERWHRGLIDTVVRHRGVLFNPKYGLTGFLGFPYLIFAEMLQPLIEIVVSLGIIIGLILGAVNLEFFLLFIMVTWGIQTLLTLFSLVCEAATFQRYGSPIDFFRLAWLAAIENAGFRQVCIVWRVFAFYRYFIGCKRWS